MCHIFSIPTAYRQRGTFFKSTNHEILSDGPPVRQFGSPIYPIFCLMLKNIWRSNVQPIPDCVCDVVCEGHFGELLVGSKEPELGGPKAVDRFSIRANFTEKHVANFICVNTFNEKINYLHRILCTRLVSSTTMCPAGPGRNIFLFSFILSIPTTFYILISKASLDKGKK